MVHTVIILLSVAGVASAGGLFVKNIHAGGKDYPGFDPEPGNWNVNPDDTIAWPISTQGREWVYLNDINSPDIICNRDATPGTISAEVHAGSTVTVTWSGKPDKNRGPIIDYLANCNGDCSKAKKTKLEFFKIDEAAVLEKKGFVTAIGYWATDKLEEEKYDWDIKIPADIKAGNYVLRHEMILFRANRGGDSRFFPQCINLKITKGGSKQPAGTLGTELYNEDQGAFKWSPEKVLNRDKYPIPGPKVYS